MIPLTKLSSYSRPLDYMFSRFRKLLVRYEKLDRSFLALNHMAASIMAFRKIKLDVKIIYE